MPVDRNRIANLHFSGTPPISNTTPAYLLFGVPVSPAMLPVLIDIPGVFPWHK
jgi:hypothetical protein